MLICFQGFVLGLYLFEATGFEYMHDMLGVLNAVRP